jgi:pimeloyl-ACP methyl ester carboxylesterase
VQVQTVNQNELVLDGCRLNVATSGTAEQTLVFFHGVTRRWQDFMPLIPSLAARWEIHALDFPGHGGSDRIESEYRTVDYVEQAVWFVEQLDRPVVLFGHSLGAMVTAAVAAAVPDRVRAIVLEDPPFETMGTRMARTPLLSYFQGIQALLEPEKSIAQYARDLAELRFGPPGDDDLLRLGDLRDPTALRFAASCLARVDPAVMLPIVEQRWLDGYDVQRVISQIRCPVLLLQADKAVGGMLVDEDAELIERTVEDCTRIRFEDVGHLIHWTRTEETLKLVTGFLESLR